MKRLTQKKLLVAIGLLVLIGGGWFVSEKTRGWRNRNPGNIRKNEAFEWEGEIGQDGDGFVIFSENKYGVRAMAKIFNSYRDRGLTTLGLILATYAPKSENDTQAYIDFVSNRTGWDQFEEIPPTDHNYALLAEAIIQFENARIMLMSEQEIREAVALA